MVLVRDSFLESLLFKFMLKKIPSSRKKIVAAIVLLVYAVLFFIIYQQKSTSFFLFNVHHVNLDLFGYSVNPQSIPGVLNTAGVIILSPILAFIYTKLGAKDFSLPFKFALGNLILWFSIWQYVFSMYNQRSHI